MKFSIFRFDPEKDEKPYMQDYEIEPGNRSGQVDDLHSIANSGIG